MIKSKFYAYVPDTFCKKFLEFLKSFRRNKSFWNPPGSSELKIILV